MPDSAAKRADPNKGELWITLDQLEKREIYINSLCSESMYKSVFQVSRKLKLASYTKNNSIVEFACKVNIKEASIFMINLSIFTLNPKEVRFGVFTDDSEKRVVKVKYDLPPDFIYTLNEQKGQAKFFSYQKFKLQPNKFIFLFELLFKEISVEKDYILFKTGSMSDCTFEEHIEDGV